MHINNIFKKILGAQLEKQALMIRNFTFKLNKWKLCFELIKHHINHQF